MRRTLLLQILLGVLVLGPSLKARAEMSDEEKKQLFLQVRQDIHPVPRATVAPTPRPKPRPADTPPPTPTPTPRPAPKPQRDEDDEKPRATPDRSDTSEKSDLASEKSRRDNDEKSGEEKTRATPAPKSDEKDDYIDIPKPQVPQETTPGGEKLNAPIVIEKSGLEEDQGLQPASSSVGGWFKRWKYLPASVRKAIDRAPVRKGRWKYIVVHNSGTRQGNAHIFDVYHRRVRKMPNGLAYHFVIGNGTSSGDGEIEIGNRWTKQLQGGHVASDYLNEISLGICLVGDLNRDKPTKAQLAALDELIQYLRGRVGKVKGKPAIVLPHKKINPKPTDCPGDRFPYGWLRDKFG